MAFNLKNVRDDMLTYMEALVDKEGPYGAYRRRIGERCDLYSTLDISLCRTIYGETLMDLPEKKRQEWIDHINSFTDEYLKDGSYSDTFGHSKLHANGMVIGALGPLGGKKKYPCRLYDGFLSTKDIGSWLETIDWETQWSASHLFWGGMHCFSFADGCTDEWKQAVKKWLLENADENTGFWRKNTQYTDRHQALGGLAHILPVFEHQNWEFPFINRTVDSVLKMQMKNGCWLDREQDFPATYLDLDALYVLRYAKDYSPSYRREEVHRACAAFAAQLMANYENHKDVFYAQHPHFVLAGIGIFGLLQQLMPEDFYDDRPWSDIFSDRRLYQSAQVEV